MDASRGGTFVLFNGNVTGKFQELVSGVKFVVLVGDCNGLTTSQKQCPTFCCHNVVVPVIIQLKKNNVLCPIRGNSLRY